MSKKKIINLLNILLIISAVFMIFLGLKQGILPPTITGIGFILIAVIFHLQNK